MLVLLQTHILNHILPNSFYSLIIHWELRLLSPLWLTDYYTTDAGTTGVDYVEPESLQWEYDDECGRMYVTLPDDSQ